MKRLLKRIAVLAALFLLADSLTGLAANIENLPKAAITAAAVTPDTPIPAKTPLPIKAPVSCSKTSAFFNKTPNFYDKMLDFYDKTPDFQEEASAFHAGIEYSHQGYVVKGSFTEIPADISLIQPLYSLDGETYQTCGVPWDLHWLDKIDDDGVLAKLQNQTCLYSNQEPLKSYLEQKLDSFYLKLRLVLKNGTVYETLAALIDRCASQPIPEELLPTAFFAPSLAVYEMRPFCGYGKYQITVRANASLEEITSCLPDTLPIKISLAKGLEHVTDGIVDCPITWKPLSLPQLAAGESVTIADAAEEIVVPKGTLLRTPTGIFQLDEPLKLSDQHGLTDEVRLVLNTVSEEGNPTGALTAENAGLEIAFHLKPTGATEIQAYVWSENSPAWTKLPDVLFAVNEQPSTANSGYALVIGRDQEPYQSYLADTAVGNSPTPFLIGLTIKGGVYDGQQLILGWPDTYEIPLALPKLGGSGGNELNAASDNKNDSTPEGQRPNLPQYSENIKDNIDSPPKRSQALENTLSTPPKKETSAKTDAAEKNILPPKTGSSDAIVSPPRTGSPETIVPPSNTGSSETIVSPPRMDSSEIMFSLSQMSLSEIIFSSPTLCLSPKTSLAQDNTSGSETQRQALDKYSGSNAQQQAERLTSRSPASDIQPPADTSDEKEPATSFFASTQDENVYAEDMPNTQELTQRSGQKHSKFPPIAAALFAIAVIGTAAAAHKMATRKKYRPL